MLRPSGCSAPIWGGNTARSCRIRGLTLRCWASWRGCVPRAAWLWMVPGSNEFTQFSAQNTSKKIPLKGMTAERRRRSGRKKELVVKAEIKVASHPPPPPTAQDHTNTAPQQEMCFQNVLLTELLSETHSAQHCPGQACSQRCPGWAPAEPPGRLTCPPRYPQARSAVHGGGGVIRKTQHSESGD